MLAVSHQWVMLHIHVYIHVRVHACSMTGHSDMQVWQTVHIDVCMDVYGCVRVYVYEGAGV